MNRRITKEIVLMARKHFLDKGEHPSEGKILNFIGFGSADTVHKYNAEVLREKREKVLHRTLELPEELASAFLSTVADRAGEISATLAKDIDEKEQCLKEACEQLDSNRKNISELETQLTVLRKEKQGIEDKNTAFQTTVDERTKALDDLNTSHEQLQGENKGLQMANRNLEIELAKHQEAARHQDKEIERLNKLVETQKKELEETKGKLSISHDNTEKLTDALEEKSAELLQFAGAENKTLAMLGEILVNLENDQSSVKRKARLGSNSEGSPPK